MKMSWIWRCITGPAIYRRYRTPGDMGKPYEPNALEKFGQKGLTGINVCVSVATFLSPILLSFAYRRGWLEPTKLFTFGLSASIIWACLVLVRFVGRLFSRDYLTFLTVLEAQTNLSNRRHLRQWDFDFGHWPVDYAWRWDLGDSEKVKPRKSLKRLRPANFIADAESIYWPPVRWFRRGLSAVAAHSVGRRMIYPGSLSLLQAAMSSALDEGRRKLVEQHGGIRSKLLAANGLEVEVMFVDRRNRLEYGDRGQTLIVVCEGNGGFYEVGSMGAPTDAGYSVLGWNHPGFGGSTGAPWPENEESAVDVVMQMATTYLGFEPSNVYLLGWSIGAFTASWAAMNYPSVGGLILDAPFDRIKPLAKKVMPASWESLVRLTIDLYFCDLDVSEQLKHFGGPILIVRRTKDEVIITANPTDSAEEQLRSNRGNQLLKGLVQFRFPHLLPCSSLEECANHHDKSAEYLLSIADKWLEDISEERRRHYLYEMGVDQDECRKRLTEHVETVARENPTSSIFPLSIGLDWPLEERRKFLLFVLSQHLQDFEAQHCTPLSGAQLRLPSFPWAK